MQYHRCRIHHSRTVPGAMGEERRESLRSKGSGSYGLIHHRTRWSQSCYRCCFLQGFLSEAATPAIIDDPGKCLTRKLLLLCSTMDQSLFQAVRKGKLPCSGIAVVDDVNVYLGHFDVIAIYTDVEALIRSHGRSTAPGCGAPPYGRAWLRRQPWGIAVIDDINVCLGRFDAIAIYTYVEALIWSPTCATAGHPQHARRRPGPHRRSLPGLIQVLTVGALPPATTLHLMDALGSAVSHG
ncbi:hypothetical protein B296_00035271 [Ensete ventricosum]|uniref:Uncharacterized protein n=1 Tax=Ensete ventricosum TaxID=4639 RepID=A0A426Z7J8_ENSVE|nr:hypothetical protein B296_00035271 [Ensete ventricosum]